MNRRESITSMIAAGIGLIGVRHARCDEPKLRKIYRYRSSPMGGNYDSVRMSQLKVGDVFVVDDDPNVINLNKQFHRVSGAPKQNDDGIWCVEVVEISI